MRLFTTTRPLAGMAPTAMLSTASSLRQPRARRTAVQRKTRRTTSAMATPHMSAHAGSAFALHRTGCPSSAAANDSLYFAVALDDKVRILRRDASDQARMVLSGRMADVCAALERMC